MRDAPSLGVNTHDQGTATRHGDRGTEGEGATRWRRHVMNATEATLPKTARTEGSQHVKYEGNLFFLLVHFVTAYALRVMCECPAWSSENPRQANAQKLCRTAERRILRKRPQEGCARKRAKV